MKPPFSFLKASGGAPPPSPAPTVSGIDYSVVDPAGGGEAITITGDNFATGATVDFRQTGVTYWSTTTTFVNATTLTFVPPLMGTGNLLDLVVVNPDLQEGALAGALTTFAPIDLGPSCLFLPGGYAVVGTQGVDAVGTWTDSSGNGNHATNNVANYSPAASAAGTPVFVAGSAIYLQVAKDIANSSGPPTSLAALAVGTEVACFLSTAAPAPSLSYEDANVVTGAGASAGICFNTDGIQWEAYDWQAGIYLRTLAVAAAINVEHFAAARWDGTVWGCLVNGNAEQTVDPLSDELSNGNVGLLQMGGGTYASGLDGGISFLAVYPTARSNAEIATIRQWARQRGIVA